MFDHFKKQNQDLIDRIQAKDLSTYAQLVDLRTSISSANSSDSSGSPTSAGLTDEEELRRMGASGNIYGIGEVLVEQESNEDDLRELGLI